MYNQLLGKYKLINSLIKQTTSCFIFHSFTKFIEINLFSLHQKLSLATDSQTHLLFKKLQKFRKKFFLKKFLDFLLLIKQVESI